MDRKIRLKIESHKKSKTAGNTLSFFSDKIKYVKDASYQHKILKEKLKDRHRIKGISFSNSLNTRNIINTNNKNKRKKKEDSFNLLDIDEANFLLSIKYYDKLKHKINSREKIERKINENLDKELLKKDINYTNLREAIYQFIRFKNKSNLYRAYILKNKMELKLANRNNKKNFINQTFKNVMSHFDKIKGKVDLGKNPLEESENEYAYKKLVEQIAKSRIKYMNKIKNEKETKVKARRSVMILSRPDHFLSLLGIEITDQNKNINTNDKKSDKDNNEDKNDDNKNNAKQCITEANDINKNNNNFFRELRPKKSNKKRKSSIAARRYFLSDKIISLHLNNLNLNNINNNCNETEMKTQRINHMKYDGDSISQSNKNLCINPEATNINNNASNTSNNQTNNNYESSNIKTENNTTGINKSNIDSCRSKQTMQDLINIEKMRKNNQIVKLKKRNSIYWNNHMRRVQTAGFKAISNKVINKPLYTTKIGDLVKQYNRIKMDSKKSKKRMREKHLTSQEEIDKIIGVKEDLLMFNLKMKFFNCSFPQKKQKVI
jgi:hypothetical protein